MPLGTLKQQLVFPSACDHQHSSLLHASPAGQQRTGVTTASSSSRSHSSSSCAISMQQMQDNMASEEQQLYELLEALNLAGLLDRFDAGMSAEVDWSAVLSLGEQQRVALIRLLYHKPDLAFLVSTVNCFRQASMQLPIWYAASISPA